MDAVLPPSLLDFSNIITLCPLFANKAPVVKPPTPAPIITVGDDMTKFFNFSI
jgi:hypothetical protein